MKALKNLCRTQNICLICTIHQSSLDVLSLFDYLYVLAKGGHNVFWGPTQHLNKDLITYGIISCDIMRLQIDTLVRISAEGIRDIRLVELKEVTNQRIIDCFKNNENNLIFETYDKATKKFCYKDVIILCDKHVTEIYQYKYKFYSFDIILLITISSLLVNTFGTDIGKYDDCFGLEQHLTCEQRQININMVDRNSYFLAYNFWIISFIKISLTIFEKLDKTKFFLYHRKNS